MSGHLMGKYSERLHRELYCIAVIYVGIIPA